MNDDAMALAALKAGVTFEYTFGRLKWLAITSDRRTAEMDEYHYGTFCDYVAAGRALGLVPDVVVVPLETATNAITELPRAVKNARDCACEAAGDAARKTWTRRADVLEATLVALGGEPS